jgi:hypothetical protein
MNKRTDAVVEAEVIAVTPGPDLVAARGRVDGEDAGLPTQRIEVKVLDALKKGGSLTGRGERLTLFRTGGRTKDGGLLSLEGDPAYRSGERYILFLFVRPDGLFIPVAPDGRLREDAQELLEPLIDGPVAEELRRKTKDDVRRKTESDGGVK